MTCLVRENFAAPNAITRRVEHNQFTGQTTRHRPALYRGSPYSFAVLAKIILSVFLRSNPGNQRASRQTIRALNPGIM